MSQNPISTPAGYAPAFAVGFSQAGALTLVDGDQPLPVIARPAPVTVPAALTGTAEGTVTVGPFIPAAGRTVMLALAGTWTGSVRLMRSTDGGATLVPLTLGGSDWAVFEANACEPVWVEEEAGASLHLAIALTSGAVTYRLAQ